MRASTQAPGNRSISDMIIHKKTLSSLVGYLVPLLKRIGFRLRSICVLISLLLAGSPIQSAESSEKENADAGAPRLPKLTGLLHNEDCIDFFDNRDFSKGKAGEMVDRYVDVLAGAGVTVLVCNTSSRRTNYRSKVWEAFWDGFDPNASNDQPFFAAVPKEQRAGYRRVVANMLATYSEGVDYPARIISRSRHHSISPWISLRMNDVHVNGNLDHPIHSDFWRKPEFFRKGHPGYYARALDYAHAEVRAHHKALIVETLELYDIDGLELDFMREPYLFSKGKEQEGRLILNEWLRDIRKLIDDAATGRGHAIKLGVRVPASPETALGLGLDAPTWSKEGLVDLVVVTPRWSTIDFTIPIAKWRDLLGDRVTLAGGLEVNYQPYLKIPNRMVTKEEATGAAIGVLSGGADVVYLFNYFQNKHPHWSPPEYQRMLNAFSSVKELQKLPRRHAVTFSDVTIPGEEYPSPLPASGTQLSFDMQLGPAPPATWQGKLMTEVEVPHLEDTVANIFVNGVAGKLKSNETLKNGRHFATYEFPLTALSGKDRDTINKRDSITIEAVGKDPITVHRVEVSLRPEGSKATTKP